MSSSFQDSVILITSRDPDLQQKRVFGTAFIIHLTNEATYLLTCAHVVRDVGGAEKVLANGITAKVVASGESEGFDLAVLRVEELWNLPVLPLSPLCDEGKSFEIAGFYPFDPKGTLLLRRIQGYIGKQSFIPSTDGSDRIKAWDLRIEDEHILQAGYSGSPVVERASGAVLAIVSHQVSKGEKGLAIAIEGIKKIWAEMPFDLFQANMSQIPKLASHTELLEVFISYSKKDKKLLDELVDYLSSSLDGIKIWHEGEMIGGQFQKVEIEKHLYSADIILLLISPGFLKDYKSKFEVNLAREKQKAIKATIIPILITKIIGWERLFFGNLKLDDLQALPKERKFITDRRGGWINKNDAFFSITKDLEEVKIRILETR